MNDKFSTWEEAVIWLRSQPDQINLVKACYYDDPLIDAADRFYHSSEWADIQIRLRKKSGRVLDFGAGRGISSYAFARDGWNVVAVEPDPSRIVGTGAIQNLIANTHLSISVIRTYAESLPFKSNSFDVVYGRQVLHHAYDLSLMCNEVSRVLKPDGIFIATREHVINKKEDLNIFLSRHPLQNIYGGENAYLLKQYLNAFKKSDIKITKILNPYASNINRFPESTNSSKKNKGKIIVPIPSSLFHIIMNTRGLFDKTPGRLYSFIGRKKNG